MLLATGNPFQSRYTVPTQVLAPGDPLLVVNPHPILVDIFPGEVLAQAVPFQDTEADSCLWMEKITMDRPMMILLVEGQPVRGLVDTGADRSALPRNQWPPQIPRRRAGKPVKGVGGVVEAWEAARPMTWRRDALEGQFSPLCVPGLTYALWGRDILAQLEVTLSGPDTLNS